MKRCQISQKVEMISSKLNGIFMVKIKFHVYCADYRETSAKSPNSIISLFFFCWLQLLPQVFDERSAAYESACLSFKFIDFFLGLCCPASDWVVEKFNSAAWEPEEKTSRPIRRNTRVKCYLVGLDVQQFCLVHSWHSSNKCSTILKSTKFGKK